VTRPAGRGHGEKAGGGRTVQQSANTESRRDALDELKAQILKHSNGEAVDSNRVTIAALSEGDVTDLAEPRQNPGNNRMGYPMLETSAPVFRKDES